MYPLAFKCITVQTEPEEKTSSAYAKAETEINRHIRTNLARGYKTFFMLNAAEHEIFSANKYVFVCVEVLWPSQPNGVMSSAVSLPNHTFTGQA